MTLRKEPLDSAPLPSENSIAAKSLPSMERMDTQPAHMDPANLSHRLMIIRAMINSLLALQYILLRLASLPCSHSSSERFLINIVLL
mmetsp:Transcript_40274/g.29692  ORF Transcript_40274/g.29692 Transcript_40274/m.29692 type:complete len:87 (+) Transcript_40274:209-469(+)